MARNGSDEETEVKKTSIWLLLLMIAGGMVLIIVGSDFTVDAGTKLAKMCGVSERIIGLTIVALGTSLPELVTSVTAARKGNADIAIGNIVGSNIYNILFILDTTALITPIPFEPQFQIDTVIAVAAGVLLWLCVFRKKKLERKHGVIMLLCEAGYLVYLFMH